MRMHYCLNCAHTRDMEIKQLQSQQICDLCGQSKLCSSGPISALKGVEGAFSSKGYFNSEDLSKLLSLIKSRIAILRPQIAQMQLSISTPAAELKKYEVVDHLQVLIQEGFTKRSINTCHALFSKMNEVIEKSETTISIENIARTKYIMQNLINELQALQIKDKELSILYKNCLDQILLTELRKKVTEEEFSSAYILAKRIYNQRNKKGLK